VQNHRAGGVAFQTANLAKLVGWRLKARLMREAAASAARKRVVTQAPGGWRGLHVPCHRYCSLPPGSLVGRSRQPFPLMSR
jgi:hypothetical protein